MNHPDFYLISQQRLHTFLEESYSLIENLGLFNDAPNRLIQPNINATPPLVKQPAKTVD